MGCAGSKAAQAPAAVEAPAAAPPAAEEPVAPAPFMVETVMSYTVMPCKEDSPAAADMISSMADTLVNDLTTWPGLNAGAGVYFACAKHEGELIVQVWYTAPDSTFETIAGNGEAAMKALGGLKEHAAGPPQRGPAEGVQIYFPAVTYSTTEHNPMIFTRVIFTPKEGVTKEDALGFIKERAPKLFEVGTTIGDIYALRMIWNAAAGNFEVGGYYKTEAAAEKFTETAGAVIGELAAAHADGPPTSRVFIKDACLFARA